MKPTLAPKIWLLADKSSGLTAGEMAAKLNEPVKKVRNAAQGLVKSGALKSELHEGDLLYYVTLDCFFAKGVRRGQV